MRIEPTENLFNVADAAYETEDRHSYALEAVVKAILAEIQPIQVEITAEMEGAYGRGLAEAAPVSPGGHRRAGLRAALEAAGFVVKA